MRALVLCLLVACQLSEDPCETLDDYTEIYDQGYTDGATCAGYNNPHSDKEDPGLPSDGDTGADLNNGLSESDVSACLWGAYDQGFSAGRVGADCNVGLD